MAITMSSELDPWEMQPGEKSLWYDRFLLYLNMGPKRTKQGAFNQWRNLNGKPPRGDLPADWYRHHIDDRWAERAAAWDRDQRSRMLERWQEEREKDRKQRIALLQALRGKAAQAIPGLDLSKASPNTIAYVIGLVTQELRKEYEYEDDKPKDAGTPGAYAIREVVVEHPPGMEETSDTGPDTGGTSI